MSEEKIEWTTDMTFPVGNGLDQNDVAKHIKTAFLNSVDFHDLHEDLVTTFAIKRGDADLAIDRATGGVVRALTAIRSNKPDAKEDPIAYFMFREVWSSLPKQPIFFWKRQSGGLWKAWNENRKIA